MATTTPEVWLRGPLPGYAPMLMPVAHALLQAREDIERVARGEALSAAQRAALEQEGTPGPPASVLVPAVLARIDRSLDQVRHTPGESLGAAREVGRARLPSTVVGLLFHAAEHTSRHVGQLITTLKVVRGVADA